MTAYSPYSGTSYNLRGLIPNAPDYWDDYFQRLDRYEIVSGYYHNIAYHSIVTYSQGLKTTERLYKHVRGVYNPVKRLVESYVSKVYGGMLDTEDGKTGAIPLQAEDDRLIETIIQLWRDSMWGQKKSLYTRFGAMSGDSFIKIVDDVVNRQVHLEVVNPAKIKTVRKNDIGNIEYVELEYYILRDGKRVRYNEIIDENQFKITIEGDPYYHFMNGRNENLSEWDNDYGFVPLVHVQHMDMDLQFGAPAIHAALHKINELNDLASILNDGMRKQVQMPLIFKNATVSRIDFGSDQSSQTYQTDDKPRKDTVDALNITGDNAEVYPVPPTIDIANGIENVLTIQAELERDLPELSLHRLREGGQLTAPGVRSAYDDAIARYHEARGNYDTGLVKAHQYAIAIGGMRGYDAYRGYNLFSLENGSLEHQIASRPVISDTLSLNEQLTLTLQGMSQNAPKTFYIKAGWSDSEADDIMSGLAREKRRADRAQLRDLVKLQASNGPQNGENGQGTQFNQSQGTIINNEPIAEI